MQRYTARILLGGETYGVIVNEQAVMKRPHLLVAKREIIRWRRDTCLIS